MMAEASPLKKTRMDHCSPQATRTLATPASPCTQDFVLSGTGLPSALIKRWKNLPPEEVVVDKADGITLIRFTKDGSAAYDEFCKWRKSLCDEDDPLLSLTFNRGTSLAIQEECWAVLIHYCGLRAQDFQAALNPALPHPHSVVGVGQPQRYHHAQLSLSNVPFRLRDPNDPVQYPAITGVAPGALLCNLTTVFGKGFVTLEPIFRR